MDDAVTMSTTKRLLLLYCSFFRITALVVGGGLAMLPVIEEIFVVKRKLLTREELLDMTALTQTVPGIIAVNSAVYIGMKIAIRIMTMMKNRLTMASLFFLYWNQTSWK